MESSFVDQNTRFSGLNSVSLSEEELEARDEKASNVGPAGIDIAYRRLGGGDSHTYGYTRDTSII
jgi:hypothetical protein